MVTIEREPGPEYAIRFGAIPLGQVAHEERRLPDEFIAASGTDVTEAFVEYAWPLIGGPLPAAFRL
jgi:6-phosphofructokinase 1